MRRLAVLLVAVTGILLAATAVAAPMQGSARSARFALRLDVVAPSGRLSLVGTGVADGAHRLSSAALTANGRTFDSVIDATSDHLVLFSRGDALDVPAGYRWIRNDGAAAAPLFDPSLPLRLGAQGAPAAGTAIVGGTHTTKYAIRVVLPDAAMLAPASPAGSLSGGLAATLWIDDVGNVRRFQAAVPFAKGTATIDETLSSFGTPAQIATPRPAVVYDVRYEPAFRAIRYALPDVESYNADNVPSSPSDPDTSKTDSGYAGMTNAKLRSHYDKGLPKTVVVVRASRSTYCIQATVNGLTAKKNGPAAPIVAGRC